MGRPLPLLSLVQGGDGQQGSAPQITQHSAGSVSSCRAAIFLILWLETVGFFLWVFFVVVVVDIYPLVVPGCEPRVRYMSSKKPPGNSLLDHHSDLISSQFVLFYLPFQSLLVVALSLV